MSFSIELELQTFSKTVKLKDGSQAVLRPLRRDDEKQLHQLFLGIPEQERMFIKHRVQDIGVIRDWCQNIDYGRNRWSRCSAAKSSASRRCTSSSAAGSGTSGE